MLTDENMGIPLQIDLSNLIKPRAIQKERLSFSE